MGARGRGLGADHCPVAIPSHPPALGGDIFFKVQMGSGDCGLIFL